jgi:threonyl-tRNA synthetase
MRFLLKEGGERRLHEMMQANARQFFQHLKQPYRAEAIAQGADQTVPVLQVGEFYDYIPLPAFSAEQAVHAFKLLEIASLPADAKRREVFLYRVQGGADRELSVVKRQAKAFKQGRKQDHRLRGKEWHLFESVPEVSTLEWFWLPQGVQLRSRLLRLWESQAERHGFSLLSSPALLDASLVRKAKLDLQQCVRVSVDGQTSVYPWTLAYSHGLLFAHVETALPVRYAECAKMAPLCGAGELWGLFNSKIATVDQAHVFCSADQLRSELISSLQFILKTINIFGFEYCWSCGWLTGQKESQRQSHAQKCLAEALEQCGQEISKGDQGEEKPCPVLQMQLTDSAGRQWKGPCIELDFDLPERLKLCNSQKGSKEALPYMLCLSVYGSIERFVALLVEHYAGKEEITMLYKRMETD